jgi:hypothetical protein
VKKGIIFETDGAPQAGDGSAHYTCNAANNTATAAKAAGIEVFTIGFGVGTVRCPYPNSSQPSNCSGTTGRNTNETAAWSCDRVVDLLRSMATDANHFYDAPDSATLIAAFQAAAIELAGPRSHLIQLYPKPIVTAVNPAEGPTAGGTAVTISGKYFTGATSVRFGGTPAAFTVTNDTSITATAPAGGSNATVNITVTTGGGTSAIVIADRYLYGP